jgi:hypothetical protein
VPFLQRRRHLDLPGVIVKERMIDTGLVFQPYSEGEISEDVVHERLDQWPHIVGLGVEAHRFVTASNVIANSRRADLTLVGNDSSYGDGIPLMVIRHQGYFGGSAGTGLNLP